MSITLPFTRARWSSDSSGFWLSVNIAESDHIKQFCEDIDGKKVFELKIDRQKKHRSLDANSYCWVLCDRIAQKIHGTKDDVYRDAIRNVGQFDTLVIKNEAVKDFVRHWNSHGVGWICFQADESDGRITVHAYYGSSVYDTAQMSRLIDYLVSGAKELGIETMTPEQLQRLIGEWNG